jgi:hypothetical protein
MLKLRLWPEPAHPFSYCVIQPEDPGAENNLTTEEGEKALAASKSSSRNPVRDYCMLLLIFRHGLQGSELRSIKLTSKTV